jgi:hypothetical protein
VAEEPREFMIFTGPMLTIPELIEQLRQEGRLLDEDDDSPEEEAQSNRT